MHFRTRSNPLAALGLAVLGACGTTPTNGVGPVQEADLTPGVEQIRAGDLYTRIASISADENAGRDTPSPGLERTAEYLANHYRSLGFQAAGDSGTYIQRYPYRARIRQPNGTVVTEDAYPPNVIAVLPGSDPQLRNEYVVLSAHFDHIGIGQPIAGDSINNGADDNGTGTASLMEIAEAFAALPEAPPRSVMFLHVSGEEKGLLGSKWFSDHPTVPMDQIIADINVDMIGRNSVDSIVVIGKNYSDMGETVEAVAERHPELGLTVSDDIWPEERFFFRSDHYNFARSGVPALFFFAGVHEDYHRPSDSIEKIDTDKVERVARMIFYTAWDLATGERPEWYPQGWAEVQRMSR